MTSMTAEATRQGRTSTTILEFLGSRAAAVTADQIDDHGLDLVRTAVVDTLGVALAGSDFEGATIVRAASVGEGAVGPSLVLGTSLRLSRARRRDAQWDGGARPGL